MLHNSNSSISKFFIAGINYKKTDAAVRGQFAINQQQYANVITLASSYKISEFFILSTCNRTEIYGLADDPRQLVDLLCTQTAGSAELFDTISYQKQGIDAVNHLFEVGAGLESQILGDYEIIGQLKLAVKFAKQSGYVGPFTERLINNVLQSTKVIKNQTALSGGTVSVSFAAVQYLKKNVEQPSAKNILVVGTGKIGRNTCKNLVDYLGTTNITLINRTNTKAAELAGTLGLRWAPYNELHHHIRTADIILVSTSAQEPTIVATQIHNTGNKIIIDLSIPYNVAPAVAQLPGVTLVNVDQLSRLKDETLQKRRAEVPKARAIIATHQSEFIEWTQMRRNAPYIQAVKQKLHDMHQCQIFLSSHTSAGAVNQYAISKAVKNMALKMRQNQQPGCSFIEAINDFMATHRN